MLYLKQYKLASKFRHEILCELSKAAISSDLEWPIIWVSQSWKSSRTNSINMKDLKNKVNTGCYLETTDIQASNECIYMNHQTIP